MHAVAGSARDAPVLSVSMIVRNEARRLPGCLDTLQGLADEISVVDTGSTDDTIAVARARGCIVHEAPWRDDFSAARNAALRHCAGHWILSLDADERIAPEDHAALRDLTRGPRDRCYRFITRNYTSDISPSGYTAVDAGDAHAAGFSGWFPSAKVRLFPNTPGAAFEGAVHELVSASLERMGIQVFDSGIPIHHYPQLHRTAEEQQDKQRFYLELGRKKVSDNPRDPKAHFELGDQYVDLGEFVLAVQAYREAVRLEPGNALWLKGLGSALLLLGMLPQAVQALRLSVQLDPHSEECWRNLGIGLVRQNDWEAARGAFESALALNPDHPETRRYLAIARNGCGDRDGAIHMLESLLGRCPDHAEGAALLRQLRGSE